MAEPESEQGLTHEELSDAVRGTEMEILEEAFKDDPPKGEPDAKETEEPVKETADAESDADRQRDERGRFKAAGEQKPDAKADDQLEPKGEGDVADKEGNDIPRWRLREIAEDRRQAVARAETLAAENARLTAQLAQPRQQPQAAPQQPAIDFLLDPDAPKKLQEQMQADFDRRLQTAQLDMDLRISHMKHGEVFEKAYEALLKEGQNGNQQLITQLTRNRLPGEAIVNWYRNRELLTETKGDLTGYKEKLKSDLLKDPEFLKAAAEAIRTGGAVQGQQSGRPNHITQLPPSLARQAGGSQNTDPIDTDDGDKAVFDYAFK